MQNWIIFGNYRGKELFDSILILEGSLAILRGCNVNIIRNELLASYFGEDLLPEYIKYFETEVSEEDALKFWGKIKREHKPDNTGMFDIIEKLDDVSMQRLARSLSAELYILVRALKGASEQIAAKFLNNMPSRTAAQLMKDFLAVNVVTTNQIERDKILSRIKELEESGDIIIGK